MLCYAIADRLRTRTPRAGGRSLQEANARLLVLGVIPEPPAASTALAATSKETNVLTLPPKETVRRPSLPAFPF